MNKKTFKIHKALISFSILLSLTSCATSSKMKELEADICPQEWNTNYTYVFVHGLGGWGHYDFRSNFVHYWGMQNGDLMKQLSKFGFDCHDASVDSHGSVWDRTCELYAQLTGTRTDYGLEHSTRCNHPRYGKDFSKNPLIEKWDGENKINLVGHSFGGTTSRLLAHLMANGSLTERLATPEDELSPLFAGGHSDWIYSVTTLATPHNGTSAYHVVDPEPQKQTKAQKMVRKAAAPKRDGKKADYDYADYDMTIPNAAKINSWLKTLPGTYYFSFACNGTVQQEDGTWLPDPEKLEPVFQRNSMIMGTFEGMAPDGVVLTKEMQMNDGMVNTISEFAPDGAASLEYSSQKVEKGIWYVMPVVDGDHMSVQGGMTIKKDVLGFYIQHLELINCLKVE